MFRSMLVSVLILVFAAFSFAQGESSAKGKVKANTQLTAKITKTIDAANCNIGEDVNFVLTGDVQGDGMMIPGGSEMYARIVNVEKLSEKNKNSQISIMFDFVQSGEDFMTLKAIILGVEQMADVKTEISDTFEGGTVLTIKGKNLKIDEGSVFSVKLIQDVAQN
jgi:hypothetical protein